MKRKGGGERGSTAYSFDWSEFRRKMRGRPDPTRDVFIHRKWVRPSCPPSSSSSGSGRPRGPARPWGWPSRCASTDRPSKRRAGEQEMDRRIRTTQQGRREFEEGLTPVVPQLTDPTSLFFPPSIWNSSAIPFRSFSPHAGLAKLPPTSQRWMSPWTDPEARYRPSGESASLE